MKSFPVISPRTIVFSTLCVFSSLSIFAQKKTQSNDDPDLNHTYTYKVLSNDPESAPNLSINIIPFYADLYSLNYNMGFGFAADYRLKNKLDFDFAYRHSYIDRLMGNPNDNPGTENGYSTNMSGVSDLSFGLKFYVKSELKDVDEDVTVKQKQTGNGTLRYVMSVPSKQLRLVGIRAHYEMFNSAVFSSGGNINWTGTRTDSAGATGTFTGNFGTYMSSGVFSVGISRLKISDLQLDVEKFGKRQTTEVHEVYADLLFCTGATYDNMFINGHQYVVTSDLGKIGVRLGYEGHVNSKFSALGMWGAEVGLRPGPKTGFDNFYLMLKFGLNISARAGVKAPVEAN